jgi:hypothetical protein
MLPEGQIVKHNLAARAYLTSVPGSPNTTPLIAGMVCLDT